MQDPDKIKIRDQVEAILRDFPLARNNDTRLWINFLKRYYPRTFDGFGNIIPDRLFEAPREGHTTRIRAIIQNKEKKYLPTKWEVAEKRGINEIDWRTYIKNEKPEIKDQLSLC